MAVSKVVYAGTTLIDLTGDTVTAARLFKGYTAHDKSGAAITGTLVPEGGGADNIVTGDFTPANSDNVSGGSIKIDVPRLPRAVFVWTDNVGTNVDRYALQAVSAVNPNATLAASQSALVSARYKSSTSSGTTLSQAASWSTYVWGNYTTTNASNYYYALCCTASRVYFKTNGNYRFRVGTTYKYIIVMDE